MAVRIINESLPADSEKKYGKARLKQQEMEQKLNEGNGDYGNYTETLNKFKEIKHAIYAVSPDEIPSDLMFLFGRLKTEIDRMVNEVDKYNDVLGYKINRKFEAKELNDTLKDKYEKSKDLLAKIFDMSITDKERDALRKELKELIK